ncbi:MAG: hypothetical protein IPL40_15770 [Proteobacteria bacterium]|nr:hypothetical protein [Pseudomonadota bacterium]
MILGLVALLGGGGCSRGGAGSGWVVGSLWVESCRGSKALGPLEDFDLGVDSFFGDPLIDTEGAPAQRQNRLAVRLQHTAGNIEEVDSAVLQLADTVQAAQSLMARQPIPFSDEALCPGCTDINTALRLRLNLFVRCPENRAALTAGSFALEERPTTGTAREATCLLPAARPAPAPCPTLGETELARLDHLCLGAFDDRSARAEIEAVLGTQGACLYLCQLGRLHTEQGEQASAPGNFSVGFDDTVAAIFSTALVDARAVRLNRCAQASGRLVGMFRFDVARSRLAQPFP